MAHQAAPSGPEEQVHLGVLAPSLLRLGLILALVGLGTGTALWTTGAVDASRFFHAYLWAVTFVLSICLGALFFVQLQHLTRAGWSVVVRRIAELLATALPFLALMLVPIVALMFSHSGALYPWADPATLQAEPVLLKKAAYLNVPFFAVRTCLFALAWGFFSHFFFLQSRKQDSTGDLAISYRCQWVAAPATAFFVLATTFFAFDYLMSLEPTFYSTIFGVYFFAGCCIAFLSATILISMFLQSRGILAASLTQEHYHDLGKLLFGFVFFWGYIGFSQYMLIWYGNIPEETLWFLHRQEGPWMWVSLALLFGHLLLPFPGLLSRHIKRNSVTLAFWAVWMLAMQLLDLYWLVMPSLALGAGHANHVPAMAAPQFGLVEIALLVGMVGILLAYLAVRAKNVALRPLKDPRLEESLAFENL